MHKPVLTGVGRGRFRTRAEIAVRNVRCGVTHEAAEGEGVRRDAATVRVRARDVDADVSTHLKATELSEAHQHHLAEEQGEGVSPASTSNPPVHGLAFAPSSPSLLKAQAVPPRRGLEHTHQYSWVPAGGITPEPYHTCHTHHTPSIVSQLIREPNPKPVKLHASGSGSNLRYRPWCGAGQRGGSRRGVPPRRKGLRAVIH